MKLFKKAGKPWTHSPRGTTTTSNASSNTCAPERKRQARGSSTCTPDKHAPAEDNEPAPPVGASWPSVLAWHRPSPGPVRRRGLRGHASARATGPGGGFAFRPAREQDPVRVSGPISVAPVELGATQPGTRYCCCCCRACCCCDWQPGSCSRCCSNCRRVSPDSSPMDRTPTASASRRLTTQTTPQRS